MTLPRPNDPMRWWKLLSLIITLAWGLALSIGAYYVRGNDRQHEVHRTERREIERRVSTVEADLKVLRERSENQEKLMERIDRNVERLLELRTRSTR